MDGADLSRLTWHALRVFAGREEYARDYIRKNAAGIVTFLPKRMLLNRKKGVFVTSEKVLFSGYLFLSGEITPETCNDIKKCRFVMDVLRTAGNDIAVVKKREMDFIFALTRGGEAVEISDAYFDEDDKIRIVAGPLKELELHIKKVDRRRQRVIVEMEIFSEMREISLSYDSVEQI